MSWRDTLQPGSFRGVPFSVQAHEGDVGRRVALHEFPQRDKPFAEDLGRKARTIAVEALLVGEDYHLLRDRLLRAVEQPGQGVLVHPYLGELRVTVMRCRLRESTAESGLARFTIEFVEAGASTFPATVQSSAASVAASAEAATTAAQASFAARHSVADKPAFVTEAAAGIFGQALDAMTGAVGKVRAVATEVAALGQAVGAAKRDVITLLFMPASAAQALVANLKQLVRSVTAAPREALALARVFYRFGLDLPPLTGTTASRAAQLANQREMVQLVRTTAVAEGARAASRVSFDSYQDAVAVRDELVETMDDLMLTATEDALYDALRALRAAVVRDVAARGADLARLVAWTPASTVPALVAAQQLYADATRAPELIARNGIRHPLFVPGAQALEVLSDAG